MSAELLLHEFGRVGDGPEAIPRLRQFVRDLAVRGWLVPRGSRAGSAANLPERGSSHDGPERHYIRPVFPIPIETLPFSVPGKWRWAYAMDICDISYGFAFDSGRFSAPGTGVPLVRIRDISATDTQTYYNGPFDERYLIEPGDYLVGMDGDFNLREWKGPRALLNQRVMRLRDWRQGVSAPWVAIPLQMILDHLHASTSQTTVKHLSAKQMNGVRIPLPPLEEQHRIVGKVDELMALCGRLEAAQRERDQMWNRLRAVSLARLSAPTDTLEKVDQNDVTFFLSHSDRMVTKPEHVADLRRTILRCAVQGLLTTRTSPGTRTAELLADVDAERAEVARGDRRATLSRQAILAPDLTWAVPERWSWRALADLALFIDYRGKTPEKVSAGVRLVTAKNVRPGKINAEPREFVSEGEYFKWMTRGLPRKGDILFTTEAPMGNAAVVDTDERFALAQRVIDLRVYGKIMPAFVSLVLNAEPFQRILDATATGLTAKGIKSAKLRRLPIPIPAVDEQMSIVAKVDELMTVCDDLEQALRTAHEGRAKLLEAVLHEAMNGWGVDSALAEATA